jgi:4'-phosphopantetheinyl transferase
LGHDVVHVWRATLTRPPAEVDQLGGLLSADEVARAERFRFPKDRDRFIVARGVLRTILGRYLDVEPTQLAFSYGARGKPLLASHPERGPIEFNVSHAGGVALYAVAETRRVGIDIEQLRPASDFEELVERCLSAAERAAVRALPAAQQPLCFLRHWTHKEAYLKAQGEGLSVALDQLEVELAPHEPSRLRDARHTPAQADRWSLCELRPGPDYAAALAVEGHGWQLTCWQVAG